MISSLTGSILEVEGMRVTLDVHGVGYEVFCTTAALLMVADQPKDCRLLIHTDVKEDSLRLYGFAERLEREVFRLLISITGIGARTAVDILSATDAKDLLRTISIGEAPELQRIKGIGKKTAERIIVELRDKVSATLHELGADAQMEMLRRHGKSSSALPSNQSQRALEEANQALCALGFRRDEAERALAALPLEARGGDAAQLVKEALRYV
jgi:Holliday junction DNA helicase RuvA